MNRTSSTTRDLIEVDGIAPFMFDASLNDPLSKLADRVREMRRIGTLSPEVLPKIQKYFRIKTIYHSNAIEGNVLDIGETRQVVEAGLTIAGKPLKDQAEAKNLGHALDFFEQLVSDEALEIDSHCIRQIHQLILRSIDDNNAGSYRTTNVAISGSEYRPPDHFDVSIQMEDLTAWMNGPDSVTDSGAIDPIVKAAVCHAWFAQIHPFIDGNGRTARILMNLILMRSQYPIAVITREDRSRYIDALEESQAGDLSPFIALILESVEETLEEYEKAAEEQEQRTEWAASLADRFSGPVKVHASNEYEVWRSAMELFHHHYRQVVEEVNQQSPVGRWYIKDFEMLPYEKYLSLRDGQSAKRTWFFRVDFTRGAQAVRYLHFFGFSSYVVAEQTNAKVSLHLSREESPFFFEKLDDISAPDVPLLREIAYSPTDEQFIVRHGRDRVTVQKIERIARDFFESVVELHFQN